MTTPLGLYPCSTTSQNCCAGTAAVKPGEIARIRLDFAAWLSENAGFTLAAIGAKPSAIPPVPATPTISVVDLATGAAPAVATDIQIDQTTVDISNGVLSFIVGLADGVAFGRMFRVNILAGARDCEGRVITVSECVLINAVKCY